MKPKITGNLYLEHSSFILLHLLHQNGLFFIRICPRFNVGPSLQNGREVVLIKRFKTWHSIALSADDLRERVKKS